MKKMNITPKNDYIMVSLVQRDTRTKSGFIISRTDAVDYFSGKVVVGDDEYKKDMLVVFPDYAPDELEIEGEMRYFVKKSDIIATYEK